MREQHDDDRGLLVGYMAHPIGRPPARSGNLERARRWLRWLIAHHPRHAICVPWLPYCDVLDETKENRGRGIRDDLVVLRRCDVIFLVGGTMSPGMEIELRVAVHKGMGILDYLHLGPEPVGAPP